MNLLIDLGNTRAKAALCDGGRFVAVETAERPDAAWLGALLARYPVRRAILSSTRGAADELWRLLAERVPGAVRFTPETPVPIAVDYATPRTLGRDRVAAAIGAVTLYGGRDLLIVDFGTALTIDFVSADGTFRGGTISPGVESRFRALHDYTASLPRCTVPADAEQGPEAGRGPDVEQGPDAKQGPDAERGAKAALRPAADAADEPLQGRSTEEAIVRGVMHSVAFEIEGHIARMRTKKGNLCVIFTGGAAKYFVKRIKNTIFAEPNLVFCGLNRILEYHATTEKQTDNAPRCGLADAGNLGGNGTDEQH